jgi:hypothetical protein
MMKTIQAENIPTETTVHDFLNSLDVSRGDVVVEKGGVPCVILSSPKALEQRRQAREQLFTTIQRIRGLHPTLDSDDVLNELESLDN